ncbi:MAG: hypothetical protein QM785_11895 [Pyrinomonadaceae bacterium]
MRIPDAEKAIVAVEKLVNYCLDRTNEVGQHKAIVFASALGITQINYGVLRSALLTAVKENGAVAGVSDEFGDRYVVDFDLIHDNKTARVRSIWMIGHEVKEPRLITCYVIG